MNEKEAQRIDKAFAEKEYDRRDVTREMGLAGTGDAVGMTLQTLGRSALDVKIANLAKAIEAHKAAINDGVGELEGLKALRRALPQEMPVMAEDALYRLLTKGVR